MSQPTINVPLTEKQLEFMIARIHEDNSFRPYLKKYLEQLKENQANEHSL